VSDLLKSLPPVHPEGRKFLAIAAGITLLFWWLDWSILGWLMAGITIWVGAFFRDPVRTTPTMPGLIVSPADGVVCQIADVVPPADLGLGNEPRTRVCVFMNVFNVHINRTPIAGSVIRRIYFPGKFLNASLDKASEDNERQLFLVRGADGTEVAFVQIAGLVARRIMAFVREGDTVERGQRIGLIRFGSRVDVYLPAGTGAAVALGQTMVAGETILARLGEPGGVTAVSG
jgi:phosphatidylserine decarboxylase